MTLAGHNGLYAGEAQHDYNENMFRDQDIPATYSNGVLRPETPLQLPENARVRISIRRVEVTADQAREAQRALEAFRNRGGLKLGGWRPSRDELHERR